MIWSESWVWSSAGEVPDSASFMICVNQAEYQVTNCDSQYQPAIVVMASWIRKSMNQAPTRCP